ncbi:family 78 glycoside hydrolase catalytic domain [Blautia schinkii]|nr:family 78 glycoside hydrolase catalytic domain [Blautia schinkii]
MKKDIMKKAKWIWIADAAETENQRACFGTFFRTEKDCGEVVLNISASTRYIVYLNGTELGRGPVRAGRNEWFYDAYSLDGLLKEGENFLAVRVWSYGWSTYQSLHAPGGLIFEVCCGEQVLALSGNHIYGRLDEGHESFAPKRNANLGFTDYYDARRFDAMWMEKPEAVREWPFAREIPDVWGPLALREIRPFTWQDRYVQHIVSVQETERGCRQITVNTRRAFFGDRRDADETIFSGLLGFEFDCVEMMSGVISFPNRTWNGIIGDFCIDGRLYEVNNANRTIPVEVGAGRHLFLLQASGKFDDLYCHLELDFPGTIDILKQSDGSSFFTVGPTQRIVPIIDGFGKVYGGLDEFNRMEEETAAHKNIFASCTLEEVCVRAGAEGVALSWVEPRYVFEDAYLLSLARTERVIKEEPITDEMLGILWSNNQDTVIQPPKKGDYRRIILDLGDIYVGSFEFLIEAPEGTVLDVYCFENMYSGDIDFTIGLNNGFRYICREGWQKYRCMTRMGARYVMITVRNAAGSVENAAGCVQAASRPARTTSRSVRIRDFHLRHMTYAISRRGEFACDDFLLTRIWDMCCHTHELCLEDSFTDCPTYEQAFWIGDAQLTALINAYVYGDYELIRHNLKLAVTARENTGLFNALTPTDWNTSIPMWMMNWVISIDQYVQVTGDESVIAELYDAVKAALDYYEGFICEDSGFLISAWNMMDWAALDIHNYGVVTGQQAILSWCYHLGAEFARQLGYVQDEVHYREIRMRLLRHIDQQLWDKVHNCYLDGWSPSEGLSKTVSIQTHVFLYLYHGIIDDEKRRVTEEYLRNPPENFIKPGSPFMLYYLHECLNRMGLGEEVLEDIRGRWGEMLHYDSTTCWEVFPGFYENSRTRSYCHSWSAAPAVFCLEQVLGVRRVWTGWQIVEIQVPKTTANWCRGAVPTPYGVIRASWERGERLYKLWVPSEIEVDISALSDWNVEIYRLEGSGV